MLLREGYDAEEAQTSVAESPTRQIAGLQELHAGAWKEEWRGEDASCKGEPNAAMNPRFLMSVFAYFEFETPTFSVSTVVS
jgi:hypothetical protein